MLVVMANSKKPAVSAKKRPTRSAAQVAHSVEIRMSSSKKMSPKQLDVVRAASGWTTNELFDKDGSPTGKAMAAMLWLAIKEHRADLTPNDLYESEDPEADFGVSLVAEPVDPTKAAG